MVLSEFKLLFLVIMQKREWNGIFSLIQSVVWKAKSSLLGSKGNIPEFPLATWKELHILSML